MWPRYPGCSLSLAARSLQKACPRSRCLPVFTSRDSASFARAKIAANCESENVEKDQVRGFTFCCFQRRLATRHRPRSAALDLQESLKYLQVFRGVVDDENDWHVLRDR
jgi:hypothetical protein